MYTPAVYIASWPLSRNMPSLVIYLARRLFRWHSPSQSMLSTIKDGLIRLSSSSVQKSILHTLLCLSLALFLSVKTKRTHVHSTTFCVFPSKRLLNSCTISSTTVCSLSTVLSSPCMCQHFLAVHPPSFSGGQKIIIGASSHALWYLIARPPLVS